MSDGWIKLHRALLSWEWFTTPNMVHFWIYCLLSASHEPKKYRGIDLVAGQFVSGRKLLSANTGLSEREVRTCIERLKSTNEMTSRSYHDFSVFTIISWEKYQVANSSDQPNDQPTTSQRPANDQPTTTIKKERIKECKKEKNNTDTVEFGHFWESYPKKVDKSGASRSFDRAIKKTTLGIILSALELQKASKDWSKEQGRFIPHPTTWLNQERWNIKIEIEDTQSWDYLNRELMRGSNGQDHIAIGRDSQSV